MRQDLRAESASFVTQRGSFTQRINNRVGSAEFGGFVQNLTQQFYVRAIMILSCEGDANASAKQLWLALRQLLKILAA